MEIKHTINNVTCTDEPWKGFREWEFIDEDCYFYRAIPEGSIDIGVKGRLEYRCGPSYRLWFFVKEGN